MSWTDPSPAGTLDLATGDTPAATWFDAIIADLLVLGGTTGKPVLDPTQNVLGGDVALTNANTFYDGPSLTPAAGIYLLLAGCQFGTGGAESMVTAKLWDGTTTLAVGECRLYGALGNLTLIGYVTATGAETYKVSAACTLTGAYFDAAVPENSPGNYACYLRAIRIG